MTLFPAMMAFAASSDLFTMTIANRVSLILVAGFGLLAVMTGMSAADMLLHAGAAALVLAVVFVFFSAVGSAVATPSLRRRRCCGSASPTSPIIWFMLRCWAAC